MPSRDAPRRVWVQGKQGKQCRDVPWRVWKLGEMRRAIAKLPQPILP
ncbi:hypothetical protein MC7420_1506 [Coleofasciculus chthonoplastes PCC 7420]|uniref:Uncharacterized protein n=1 Tax=Coleofasciculus chthonoplastes PCC 7420 TaxID=118168 RepID=B4VR82_9CYAN|nr:hypothetical protein [Coleofasciculus chthonoplastes]EDX75588.1 hypothetical protein MC7420_1506 [Coleofasciculus chthonoplastes PCC 7420]